MTEPTLALVLVVHVVSAVVFVLLGVTLALRPIRGGAGVANGMFALWWFSIAFQQGISAARIVLVGYHAPLTLHVALQFVNLAAICVGLAGLLYYLLYLYTGRSVVLWPIVTFYALYCGWMIGLIARWGPEALLVSRWSVAFAYVHPPGAGETLMVLTGLAGPQLLTVLGLAVLAFRLPAGPTRVRVVVITIGILVWFSSSFIGVVAGLTGDAWQVTTRLLPLAVGASILLLYRPPRWLRSRLPPEAAPPSEREATPA